MTVGELARLFNAERKIGADLHVIPCEGWRREDLYDRTGLLWVNPSPNMRSLTEALLYPGVGPPGGDATWRPAAAPTRPSNASAPPGSTPAPSPRRSTAWACGGVRFVPIRFTPEERQYAGTECGGVYIAITDRDRLEPVSLGIGMASVLRAKYPDEWKPEGFLRMLADQAAYKALIDGREPRDVEATWKGELDEFVRTRQRYLIYK